MIHVLCSLKEAGHLPHSGHNYVFDFDGVDVAAGPCLAGESSPTISGPCRAGESSPTISSLTSR